MLKMALLDCAINENVAALTEDGAFALFFRHKLVSSRREVLIRIVLLRRKTLIETKNRTLKCLKWHYLTVR